MQVFRSIEEIAACQAQDARRSVATIGSFDGIHRAHQALLQQVCEIADASKAVSVAVSFEPHPLAVVAPNRMPRLLTPLPVKLELLAATRVERLLLIPFTTDISRWTPEQFVEEVLVKALRATTVIVGDNFRFGYRQSGTPELLAALGEQFRFDTRVFPKMSFGGRTVSSSEIRSLLDAGNVSPANRLLGRTFAVRDRIESGLGIGSKQTVPTFNLGDYTGMIPAHGVYITRARLFDLLGRAITKGPGAQSVTNIGTRPTFGERSVGIETHLIEELPESAAAAVEMEISFLYRLRDEKRFESPTALLTQILSDVDRAKRYFRRISRLSGESL
jgi:riboflavin kinase/FMN adenylyltransferase